MSGVGCVFMRHLNFVLLCAVAKTIVNMEQTYVTAAFFRHRTAERYKAMMQAQQTARLLGEGAPHVQNIFLSLKNASSITLAFICKLGT